MAVHRVHVPLEHSIQYVVCYVAQVLEAVKQVFVTEYFCKILWEL